VCANTKCDKPVEDDHDHPSYCYMCTLLYGRIYARHRSDPAQRPLALQEAGFNLQVSSRVHERVYITASGRQQFKYTKDEYAGWLLDQDGRCLICLRDDLTLVVDHDHETYEFRGLLCGNCNAGIGMLGDDPERLMRAASYLVDRRRVRPQEF